MNLLICHDLKFFGDAMARWLQESGKVNVVGVITDPNAASEVSSSVDAELLSSRAGQEKMRERSGRRVLLVPERTPQSEALAKLYGFDGVVEASGLDGPLEDFVAQLEGIVSAPSAGSSNREPELIDVYTSVFDSRAIVTQDAVDERIVNLVAEGLSDKQIGTAIGLSAQTVRNRISRMLTESGLRNRTELAVQFVRNHPDVLGKGVV
jgi:DNA-binding NarL/FixJ family response regulator